MTSGAVVPDESTFVAQVQGRRVVPVTRRLLADGETPVGSIFVIDARDRTATEAFTRSDPYYVNEVWETVQIHGYSKKRGTPIPSRRSP